MKALKARGHDCTLVCPPGSGIDSAAREAAIPVRNLFCAGDLDLPFAYRLAQYLKDQKPDILHCHSRRGADMLGGLAASFAEIPAVVSRRVDHTEMRMIAALRYRPFSKIIAISEAIADVLRERGIEDERIVVIRSAVDVDRFEVRPDCAAMKQSFSVPADKLVIAAAGQLIARKGHRFLLDAIAALDDAQRGRVHVMLFGQGELEQDLRAQADKLGIGDIVSLPGFRDDLDDYFACLDIFVHPALNEGLGVAALKAAAAGVPVVGFKAGGVVEAVADGETGILVNAGDVAALTGAIGQLVDDESLRRKLGAAGHDRMRNEFSIEAMVDAHEALYESILQ